MHSLNPDFLKKISLTPAHAATIHEIGEYKGKQQLYGQQLPEILNSLQIHAVIESSESSNRLEGIVASRHKINDLVLHNAEPETRSEQEIAGYRDALNLIHASARDMPFSVNVVRQLHSMIHGYLPGGGGAWKIADNDIVEKDARGRIQRIRFRTVPAFRTDDAMRDLGTQYQSALTGRLAPPLIIVPLTVLDFLCIHPFADGNGRTARLLTLLLLYHFGYDVGRYISLERIFEQSKENYYETLYASSQGWHDGRHNPYPWMTYFWGVMLRAYQEYERRVTSVKDGGGIKAETIRQAVARMPVTFTLNDLMLESPGASREWVRRVLREMKEEGVVEVVGVGRGAKWRRKVK